MPVHHHLLTTNPQHRTTNLWRPHYHRLHICHCNQVGVYEPCIMLLVLLLLLVVVVLHTPCVR